MVKTSAIIFWTILSPLLFLILQFSTESNAEEYYIESENVTNWGGWGKMERCSKGKYAWAYQLKVQDSTPGHRQNDETALNGIKLFCSSLGAKKDAMGPGKTSKIGDRGVWKLKHRCSGGFLVGFQLRSLEDLGPKDDSGATNLKMFCSGGKVLLGDGIDDWGSWRREFRCEKGQLICGIQTQVELKSSGVNDATELNNVRFECCDIPSDVDICEPRDGWKEAVSCDNTAAGNKLKCSYAVKVGTTKSKTQGTGGGESTTISAEAGMEVGGDAFGAKMSAKLGVSGTTQKDWRNENSDVFSSESSVATEWEVPGGHKQVLMQIEGVCGPYTMKSKSFQLQDWVKDENGQWKQLIATPVETEAKNIEVQNAANLIAIKERSPTDISVTKNKAG